MLTMQHYQTILIIKNINAKILFYYNNLIKYIQLLKGTKYTLKIDHLFLII